MDSSKRADERESRRKVRPKPSTTVLPRSFHTNINYFRGTVKKKKILRGEVRNVKQTKLINFTV
jgi:hypothetical protein